MVKRFLIALFILSSFIIGQTIDPPAGYTQSFGDNERLKLYDDDDWPGADSLNDDKNIIADAFRKSEFEVGITKVDVVNGILLVSSGAKVDEILLNSWPTSATIRFQDVSDKGISVFQVNDAIVARVVDSDGTVRLFWPAIVTAVSGLDVTMQYDGTAPASTGTPINGDVFARIGNLTNSARQSSIIIQAEEMGLNAPPKITFKNNVATYGGWINEATTFSVIGNMKGEYGYLGDYAGVGFGSYNDDKTNIVIDTTDGFQVRRKDLKISQWETDGKITVGRTDNDFNNVTVDTSDGIQLKKGSQSIVRLDFDGKLRLGQDTLNSNRIEIAGGDAVNFYYNDGSEHVNTRISPDSIIVGENANGKFRTEIESDGLRQYYKSSGGTDYRLFDLFNVSGNPYLTLGTTNDFFYRTEFTTSGIQQIYNNGTSDEIWTDLSLGNLTLGITTNENLQLTPTALSFYDNSVVYGSLSSSNWTLGRTTTENIYITPTDLNFRDNGVTYGSLSATKWTLGRIANSTARTEIQPASITQTYRNSGGTDLTWMIMNVGGLQMGVSTYENILLTNTALTFRDNGTTLGSLSSNLWVLGQNANNNSRIEISPSNGVEIIHKNGSGVDDVKISLDASGNATFDGSITASSGSIGGWTINATNLFGSNLYLESAGIIRAGQTAYATGTGFWLGYDSGFPKFSVGNSTSGKMLSYSSQTGLLTLDGGIITDIGQGSELSIQGWTQTMTFSATDYNTMAWTSGQIRLLDGTVYNISGGNSGDVSGTAFVFLDINISTTALQTSVGPSSAVGPGRIIIGQVTNVTDVTKDCTFTIFGGYASGGISKLITADNIVANTVTANEIAANTITANEMNVGQLSAISADLGTITAGSIDASLATITNLDADNITSGTLTSRTVQTSTSGKRIILKGNAEVDPNRIEFHNSTSGLTYIEGTYNGGASMNFSSGSGGNFTFNDGGTSEMFWSPSPGAFNQAAFVLEGYDNTTTQQFIRFDINTPSATNSGSLSWGRNASNDGTFTFYPTYANSTDKIQIDGVAGSGESLELQSGNGTASSGATQIQMSFNNGSLYSQAIKTQHSSSFDSSNQMWLCTWNTSQSSGDIGNVKNLTLKGSGATEIKAMENELTTVTSGTTIDVTGKTYIELNYGAITTITNFTGTADVGHELKILKISGGTIAIQDNANISLNPSSDYVMSSGKTLWLIKGSDGVWYEHGRN